MFVLRFDIRHCGRLSDRILGLSHKHDSCQDLISTEDQPWRVEMPFGDCLRLQQNGAVETRFRV